MASNYVHMSHGIIATCTHEHNYQYAFTCTFFTLWTSK